MRRSLATGVVLGVVACAAAAVGSVGTAHAVTLNGGDVDFILEQIKKAEAHAAGGQLSGPGPEQIGSPQLPEGLRTVNGRFNNLVPGQEDFGAADRLFPRLTTPFFRPAETFRGAPTSYEQTATDGPTNGVVADSQPRVISNLIVDQTTGNPAAEAAAAATEGSETDAQGNLFIPNRAPDEGLSAPYNSWFTLFGQFFDHGLDLATKGQSGTVIVPLKADDPLCQPSGCPTPPFMVLSRARNQAGPDGLIGTQDDVHEHTNTTTPFVDQNQTYTSHPSHQVFLREYELNQNGDPVSTGRLLERLSTGEGREGLATWADVKQQARDKLGIELDDQDVLDVPLVRTDQYGEFTPDPATGFAQIVTSRNPVTFDSGTPAKPVDATGAVRSRHAFLDDIAHHANPFGDHDNNPATDARELTPDSDPGFDDDGDPATYDDELLDRHFITGDGRGNENIGLTAVHHVFHSEHNRQVGLIRNLIEEPGGPDPADWQLPNGAWDGERLFQAARFVTEMEYQHLVFEEFARKVQPQVNVFDGYKVNIDPAITAEFAHTVYRFGHSMLTETVARENADGTTNDIKLLDAFLNPLAYSDDGSGGQLSSAQAAGSIIRGMTKQRGNEIDEFVTGALRNNLLGLPLDLATINIARGRDTGVPPLNSARRTFFHETPDAALEPYVSWSDFELGIKHPESLVNFIAAYGTHPTVVDADSVADKREAARLIVEGGVGAPDDRVDFLESTGDWATEDVSHDGHTDRITTTGVDLIDFWVGGLAERQMPFGGLLGSTFNFVFETQMEDLQDGDRLYYLSRTAGLNFLTQLEENSFAELVMRNTDIEEHLPGDIFSRPDYIFELADVCPNAPEPATAPRCTPGPLVNPDNTDYDESVLLNRRPNGTVRFSGGEHIVMGGTDDVDWMHAGIGDDTLWGDAADDRLEGDAGNDSHNGGAGDDILTDVFGDDNIKAGDGDDALNGGQGFDLLLGGFGNDFVVAGSDPKETFAGEGDDYAIAGDSADTFFGNEGDDWIEGGQGFDLLQGDNGDPFQQGRTGDDVINGDGGDDDYDSEGGDDVMLSGVGTERMEGMIGFDWVTSARSPETADFDMAFTGLQPPNEEALRDRFDDVEGLSGWNGNDVLRGDTVFGGDDAQGNPVPEDHTLSNPDLIDGLRSVIGGEDSFSGGNILLGGAGSDVLEGRGGNDIIDGDRWLDAQISVRDPSDPTQELRRVDSMKQIQGEVFAGTISPGQLRTVRTIRTPDSTAADVDTVEFTEDRANYDFVPGRSSVEMRVVHARGTLVDGTDVLRNVEQLRFPNRTINLRTLPPTPATGTVEISDTTPTEDQELTATRAFDDPNGVDPTTLVYRWQRQDGTGVWQEVATGHRFAPGDAEVGRRLRVVARFNDLDGNPERVISNATSAVSNVNDPATGRPTISDTTPQRGQQLSARTAPIGDADGMTRANFSYRWQESDRDGFRNIPGADGRNFTPTANQVGRSLRVAVTYTDDRGTPERVVSLNTAAVSRPR